VYEYTCIQNLNKCSVCLAGFARPEGVIHVYKNESVTCCLEECYRKDETMCEARDRQNESFTKRGGKEEKKKKSEKRSTTK